MKTTMRVTRNTFSIFVAIVATMNAALAETETQEPISGIFGGMFKHHFSEDWSFAVGSRVWIHEWETAGAVPVELDSMNKFLPDSRGFVASLSSDDTETTLIPVASLRYKNLFVTAGHYLDTNFDFPENTTVATIQDPIVQDSFVVTDITRTTKLSAGRLEWDASLGYFLHRYVAVTAGYKFIQQDFNATVINTFRFLSLIDGSSQEVSADPEIIKGETEISGPFVGLVASVPIGSGVGVYGSFAYGFLEAEFEAPGQPDSDEESTYILADGGLSYTESTDYLPVWMPLSSATVYAGYRYQDIDTETGTSGDFNDQKGRDVTKGFVIGVNMSF